VVLDGAFSGFPHKNPDGSSDDGTVELVDEWLKKWSNSVRDGWLVLPREPWVNQMMKRSFYFRFGMEGDWFLVIDGDEVVESGLRETKEILEGLTDDMYWVEKEVVQKQPDPSYSVIRSLGLSPRLFRYREGLKYGLTYDADFSDFPLKTVPLQMRHLRFPPIRNNERRVIKSERQTSADFAKVTLMKNPGRRVAGTQVRLFRYRRGLRYGCNHNAIVDLGGNLKVISELEPSVLTPLVLEIIPRPSERDVQMSEYRMFRKRERIEY